MSEMISRRSNGFHLQARGGSSLGWASALLLAAPRNVLRAVRHTWKVYSDERLLQELSDYQLRDIGIRREHISHIARSEWDI